MIMIIFYSVMGYGYVTYGGGYEGGNLGYFSAAHPAGIPEFIEKTLDRVLWSFI